MKSFFLIVIFVFSSKCSFTQRDYLDSLKEQLNRAAKDDTSRVVALFSLADYYGFIQFDSCLFYADQTLHLSEKLNYSYGRFLGYMGTFHGLNSEGNYSKALEAAITIRRTAEELRPEKPWLVPQAYYFMGLLEREMSNYPESKIQFRESISAQQASGDPMPDVFASFSQLGALYLNLNQLDSALVYAKQGYELGAHSERYKIYYPLAIGALGNVYMAMGNYPKAKKYFNEAIHESEIYNNTYFVVRNYNNLATLYSSQNSKDSSIYYSRIALQLSLAHKFGEFALDASRTLTHIYDSDHKVDSTLKYMKIMLAERDSVFSQSKGQQFQQYAFNEIQRLQKINTDKEKYQNRVRIYILLAALVILLALGIILFRNNKQKQLSNVLLRQQKEKVEETLRELKSAQSQLIQSEKMASLGELTAGIAHEIQNPLNFVNNFSEVNNELIEELRSEKSKRHTGKDDQMEDDLLNDIARNLEKISYHGKRADAIVKGMLQHSRASTKQTELIDINALADEYLRLAYHGLRAKDKDFNAKLETDFDSSIGKISIVSQDMGRVLLNLFNNAFYAVNERAKQQAAGYEPKVIVTTKAARQSTGVVITVNDNGHGIPKTIVDKIFQPFFTTKPTGQGTGLGLSLAYDIVKAHGGEIRVETKEDEGTTFLIQLPAM